MTISGGRVLQYLVLCAAILGMAAPAAASGKRGGTLVYAQTADPSTLDTARAAGIPALMVSSQIFDHLVHIGPDGAHRPALALSWENTPDLKRYTFRLRKGVKFHDGTPFNAEAVRLNYERFKDRNTSAMAAQYQLIEKIDTPDEHTVIFHLNRPNVAFVEENVSEWRATISSPTAVKKFGKEYGINPVGTGPWKFVQWIADDRIVLERNDQYFGGAPLLDRLVIRSIPDDQTRFLEVQRGSVHMAHRLTPELLAQLAGQASVEVQMAPSLNIRFLMLNHTVPVFQDRNVRLAIYHAIDADALVRNILKGTAVRSRGPVYVRSPVIHPTLKEPEYNPAKAKELLAEAGWKPGPDGVLVKGGKRFEVIMPYGVGELPKGKDLSEAMQQYLAQVGIAVNVREMEQTTWRGAAAGKQYDMTIMNIGPRSPDPVLTALDVGFKSKGRLNWSGYANPELDVLLDKGASVANMDERKKHYYRAQEVVMQDVAAIFTHNDLDPMAVRKDVEGYKHSAIQLNNLFDKVSLK
jgi:peptide/nickel transport system substrate-binding protein